MKRAGRGRPLRFVGMVATGWIGGRIALLWPFNSTAPPMPVAPAQDPLTTLAERHGAPSLSADESDLRGHPHAGAGFGRLPPQRSASSTQKRGQAATPTVASLAFPALQIRPAAIAFSPDPPPERADRVLVAPVAPAGHAADRWQASVWAMVRSGRGIGTAPNGGQIGGSQAGVRITYRLDARRRIAAFGRLIAPLAGRGAEATGGIEWQPGNGPIRLVAERRFGLKGIAGGPALGIMGGIDRVLGGFRIEGYGQAGAVWRMRQEPYADGALRVMHHLKGNNGPRLYLGVGMWGAAQRDAQRLDMGPSLSLVAPVTGRTLRATVDWRQRVAGNARPGSGPALTLGGDF